MTKKHLEKNQILNTLKTSLSYSDLILQAKECEGSYMKTMNLNFTDSLFSTNRKFRFPYTWESALLIVLNCTFFTNSKDLLISCHFKDALNLHTSSYSLKEANEDFTFVNFTEFDEENFTNSEFARSKLPQNDYFLTLEISNWSYENLVISATFFYLEHIHAKCLEKKLFLATSDRLPPKMGILNKAFLDLEGASACISLLLLSKTFGKNLFFTLKKTNFFLVYPHIWLYGFSLFIKTYGNNALYDYESQHDQYFFNKVKKNNLLSFSYIFFYLKAFDYVIPKKIRKLIFFTCYNTKNVHFLYYVLNKYRNILDYSINPNRKKYNDYVLNSKLSYKLVQLGLQEDK